MNDTGQKHIVVMVCAYEEEDTLGEVLDQIKDGMKGYSHSILIIDDGSTDTTALIARKCGAEVVSHPYNLGLAQAFRTGCKKALEMSADIIIHIDGDGQYSFSESAESLLKPVIRNEADLVLGWRKHKQKMPVTKRLGNFLFSKVVSYITRQKINDAATGFRCFTADVAKMEIISNFSYTAEQIIRAIRVHRMRVLEVPIHFYARKSGESRLFKSSLGYAARAGVNILRLLRDFSPIKFFGSVGLGLIFAGIAVGLILGHDLLSLGCFLVGIQVLVLGFIADMRVK